MDLFVKVFIGFAILVEVLGHGRLFDPPSRASAWRVGFRTPPNTNDMEGFCGGFERQWLVNKGRCGICGDPYDERIKPHEAPGGIYATGTIVRTYREGDIIPVTIQITATHRGYYEFSLCPVVDPARDPQQECFEKYPLSFVGGTTGSRFYLTQLPAATYRAQLQLPPGVSCPRCIIQWTYVTGNRWGVCDGGQGRLGCGPQETFRACSDVTIQPGGAGPAPTQAPITLPAFIPTPAPYTPVIATPEPTLPPIVATAPPTVATVPPTVATPPPTLPTQTPVATPYPDVYPPSPGIMPVETAPPMFTTPSPTLQPTWPEEEMTTRRPGIVTQPTRPQTVPFRPRPTVEIPGITPEPAMATTTEEAMMPTGAPVPTATVPATPPTGRCVAIGTFAEVTGANQWCRRNCFGGFCPAEFCFCR